MPPPILAEFAEVSSGPLPKAANFQWPLQVQEMKVAIYKLGSKGEEVTRIQEKLKALGFYRRPIDGSFAGGTEAAVKAFQKVHTLTADGVVGSITWEALFEEPIPQPSIVAKPPDNKCPAITGSFETGQGIPECFAGLSGDFDGQGLSLGVLQWNFGQETLQPLLGEMMTQHPELVKEIFQEYYDPLVRVLKSNKQELMKFVRSIQHPVQHFIFEPWRGMFKSLGRTDAFQNIQVQYAQQLFQSAVRLCSDYGLWSERSLALMFDIKAQNGGIDGPVRAQILDDFQGLTQNLPEDQLEVQKMRVVANRRAEAANPRWVENVRARKLCCANGGGTVHGIPYDLEGQFGIRLTRYSLK